MNDYVQYDGWKEEYFDEVEYADPSYQYDIEATEYKIYDRTTGDLAAVIKSFDEHCWNIEIKSIQDAHSWLHVSAAIQRAINNKVL